MATTVLAWYGGCMIGYTVSYFLAQQGVPWRIVLGSSTIIAVILLIARIGLPESPRWLSTDAGAASTRPTPSRISTWWTPPR